jgi:tetratricopeptide (TPR) repeat protein
VALITFFPVGVGLKDADPLIDAGKDVFDPGAPDAPVPRPPLGPFSPEQHRALAYASAIGREFDFALLVAAMGAPDEQLAEDLERLVQAGVLRERPGGDRFLFVDDEVRAQIYQTLTASRLRVLHRKIAEAMERAYPTPSPEVLGELGRHFFLGKVPDRSIRYNRQAADAARGHGSPEEAAHFLERARVDLRTLAGDHARDEGEVAHALGDLYYTMGDVRAADRLYAEALERAGDDPARRARLLVARAEVAREEFDTDAALASARQARELFARSGDVSGLASVHRILGRIAYHRGAYREALDEGIRALDLLQPSGDPKVLGRLCIDIGNAFSMLGPATAEDALEWYDRAIPRLSEAGDWAEVARAHLNKGTVLGQRSPRAGLDSLEVGRQFAERAHETRWTGWALARGVELHLALGEVDEATHDNDQARRLLERADDPLGLTQVALNEGLIQERRGIWDQAEAAFRRAIEKGESHGLIAEVAEAQFNLARLFYKTRDFARAREAFRAAAHLDLPAINAPLAPAFAELGRQLDAAAGPGGDGTPGG